MAIRTTLNTSSRKNDDEKYEKAIRSLVKLPENRRCINCGSLGPQYVCTNFAIFVCTACSGIHREFTHRIKSISMAKFTGDEVRALQEGGNERAREVFFRDWDPHKFPLPDSGNADKLREFIKNVYIEKRYAGDRGPPRRSERDDARRPSPRRTSDMRSPRGYGETRRYEEPVVDRRRSNEGRSSFDGNDNDRRFMGSPASVFSAPATLSNERSGGRRTSQPERAGGGPTDRRYDERSDRSDRHGRQDDQRDRYDERERYARDDRRGGGGGGGGYEDGRRDSRRPAYRETDEFGSPPIQPVSSILGDNYAGSRSGRFDVDYASPVHPKRGIRTTRGEVEQSGSTPNSAGHQRVNSGNLIDWNIGDEDPATAAAAAAASVSADPFGESLSAPAANGDGAGWATFDTGLANGGPAAAAAGFGGDSFTAESASGNWAGFGGSQPTSQPVQAAPGMPGSGAAEWSTFGSTAPQAGAGQEWSGGFGAPQQQPQLASFQPPAPQQMPVGHQPPVSQGPPSKGGRQEIPEDFFAQPSFAPPPPMPYASPYAPQGGPQSFPPQGPSSFPPQGPPSFPPQGPPSMGGGPPPHFMQPAKTKNPFDLPGDPPPSGPSSSAFPNMGPLQGALPNYHSGSFSTPGPASGPPSGQWGAAGPSTMSLGGTQNNMMTPPVMTQANPMGPTSIGAGGPYSMGPGSFGGGMPPGYAPQPQYAAQQLPVASNPFG